MSVFAYSSRNILWLSNLGTPPPTIMISDCSPLLSYCSISVNVSPASVLTCHVYSIVPSEVPFAINIAFPLDLTETSAGLESIVAADADSRKS